MKVIKKVNNNVAMAVNSHDEEVFVIGKGLGFKKPPYFLADDSKMIEKIFVKKGDVQYETLFKDIPKDIILVTEKIISKAENFLGIELKDSMLVALSDHINVAVNRNENNEEIQDILKAEIKHIYPYEYEMGKHALTLIEEALSIRLSNNEAGFIALHFVNGQLDHPDDFSRTSKMTDTIKDIIKIVKYTYGSTIDTESVNFSRFVLHLRYLVYRLMNDQILSDNMDSVLETIHIDTSREQGCVERIKTYLLESKGWTISKAEELYLILHLNRLISQVR